MIWLSLPSAVSTVHSIGTVSEWLNEYMSVCHESAYDAALFVMNDILSTLLKVPIFGVII